MTSILNLATLTSTQGVVATGYGASGYSVRAAGDINNDSYADVIIGGIAGNFYVLYGSASLPSTINLTSLGAGGIIISSSYQGEQAYDHLVGAAGDVNKDGYPDIIIGTPFTGYNSTTGIYSGAVYIIYGGASIASTIDLNNFTTQGVKISGIEGDVGFSVSAAGDVNKDGYADCIIGAPATNSAYVIFGGESLPSTIDLSNLGTQGFTITGITGSVGFSVCSSRDVNKDGYADIIIGSPATNSVYLIYGGESLPSTIDLSNLGTQGLIITGTTGSVGFSVSSAGDVNNDGYYDIIIGAYLGNSELGEVYVIYGNASLPSSIDLTNLGAYGFSISGVSGNIGFSVSGAGDVNKDGYADLIIGAPYANDNEGEAYVVFGSATPSNIDLSTLTDAQGYLISGVFNGRAGFSVSGAGDVNKDGYADLIIGAPYASDAAGETYIIFGAASGFEA